MFFFGEILFYTLEFAIGIFNISQILKANILKKIYAILGIGLMHSAGGRRHYQGEEEGQALLINLIRTPP